MLGYLQNADINAQCFLEEAPYVDGDYLEDYSSFYVSSFPPYSRYCKRLHFFNQNFSQEQIDDILLGDDPNKASALADAYVGFIVVRPLPEAVIGRTVLRTFKDDGGRRHFPTIRNYSPCLNGISLPITSLAFEEQDSSVAACATVALWSAFHKTHFLFGSPRPRPAAITKAANAVRGTARALPSGGLNAHQMGEAIRAVGLEPEYFSVSSPAPMLASLAYAYLQAGIPIILVAFVEQRELHAVTLVGYSQLVNPSVLPEAPYNNVISYPGERIDRLYVHDDGVGPFASIGIEATPAGVVYPGTPDSPPIVLKTDWKLDPPQLGRNKAYFLPSYLIVPAYPKIRVPFFAMHAWVARFMCMLIKLRGPFRKLGLDVDAVAWDIRLKQVNEFKGELRGGAYWGNSDIRALSEAFLPRFLWLATMRHNGVPTMMLIADATDAKRSCPILRSVWFNVALKPIFQGLFALPAIESVWSSILHPRLYDTIKTGEAPLHQ